MKKLIAIVMIICIMLCGCSKSSETPVSDVQPTNIPTETLKAEITPTEMPCDICHKTGNCKPYESKKWNPGKADYDTVLFNICENCWDSVMANEQDIYNYDSIVTALNVIMTDTKALTYYKDKTFYVGLSKYGIDVSEEDDWLKQKLQEILGIKSLTEIKATDDNAYIVKVENATLVTKYDPPKSILFPSDEKSVMQQEMDDIKDDWEKSWQKALEEIGKDK